MIAGGIVELVLGVDAAGKSLEEVAAQLTEVRDAGAVLKRPGRPTRAGLTVVRRAGSAGAGPSSPPTGRDAPVA